ncbi:HNH endonuclease [uncultured Ramlibacter sp.]|uniref:HNH endonuclease n=1 Tax=uncultured Ramlibacter sp. TaxID=260755 RepID=UPI00345BAB88
MPGTKHFGRMQYNVARGLREIVAPRQTMTREQWARVLKEFGECCTFCGGEPTRENRGIVPDHLVPVTKFGELVPGNVVPACQTCNDSRGEKDWRPFLRSRYPGDAEAQIALVEAHVQAHGYEAIRLETALSIEEQVAYSELLSEWERFLETARRLRDAAEQRRKREL